LGLKKGQFGIMFLRLEECWRPGGTQMITAAVRATTHIEELVREAGRQESRQEGMQAGRQLDSNTHQHSKIHIPH